MCFRKFAQLPMIVASIKIITGNISDLKTARIFKFLLLREVVFDGDLKKAL